MKRTLGMNIAEKGQQKIMLPRIDGDDSVKSTLNGDDSDKGVQQKEDKKISAKYAENESIKTSGGKTDAKESPFEDMYSTLSRPFQYILSIREKGKNTKNNESQKKNITNNIWAIELAEEIQHFLICEIKHKHPAARIRDTLVVSSTKYMSQIFEHILNLFESDDYSVKYDIEELFELLIKNIYRLEGILTPTFQESINLDYTREKLRKYKKWVIEQGY